MRAIIRLLLTCALTAAFSAIPAVAGGVPSPFGDPETSRSPAKKKSAPAAPATDDIVKPSELPAGGGASAAVERETLTPLEAEPALGAPAANGAVAPARETLPSPGVQEVPPGWGSGNIPARSRPTESGAPPQLPGLDENSRTVMREEMSPVMAQDGSGLPYELWQGMTLETIEKAIATLEIPPRSPALHELFTRLITSDVPPPRGGDSDARFTAVRVEALHRSGLIEEAAGVLAKDSAAATDPVLALLSARTAIARGDRDAGCSNVKAMNAAQATLPQPLKGQSILVRAYCAAVAGQRESAQLQVALARDEGVEESAGFSAIDAIASGAKPTLSAGQKVGPVDWRILELGGAVDARAVVETAGPGVLAIIARDTATEPATRLAAAERAAQLNAIKPADLANAYREFKGGDAGAEGPAATAVKHAALFQAAEDERTPLKKARLIRSYLDEAKSSGLYRPALQMIASAAASIQRVAEIGWFAETAVETSIASGDYSGARAWAEFGASLDSPGSSPTGYTHWLALADLADPAMKDGRSRHLAALEDMAVRGRFSPEQLHRLATVLDALQIQVPIPLWELASRTPQPNEGFLPETGVLSALAAASKKKEFGHTVLLAMQSLGPNGAEGAHMIALGDSIRALLRAGLDKDARQLALEALFMGWPRAAG
jgi:hypothetical protein